jgi:ribosomal protein S27AE
VIHLGLFKKKKIKMEDIFDPAKMSKKGKYTSKPIYREVVLTPGSKECPECGSHFIRSAGYGDRLECQNCGKVFR